MEKEVLRATSTNLIKAHTATTTYLFPELEVGSGPNRSKYNLQNTLGTTGITVGRATIASKPQFAFWAHTQEF